MRENAVKRHAGHGFSQFELSKNVLNNLKQWKLKNTTKLVLLVLVDCYNPNNGAVIFPSMEYIANIADISLTSTKEGIKELINKGLIIKSKRSKIQGNYNKYLLTQKVHFLTSEQSENEFLKQSEFDHFMNRTKKEEQKKNKQQNVVVSLKTKSFHQSVTLEDIPEIIKNNPKVNNPCAYWASLSDEVKAEKIKEQKKNEEKIRKREEKQNQKLMEEKKEKVAKQKHKEECRKPITEQYTYETACSFIKKVAILDKKLVFKGLPNNLATTFNIDINKLLNT